MTVTFKKTINSSDLRQRIEDKQDQLIAANPSLSSSVVANGQNGPTQIIVLGLDPRVQEPRSPQPPELYLLEFSLDSLDNPNVKVHFNIDKQDVGDEGSVISFDIYRRQIQDSNNDLMLQRMQPLSLSDYDKLANYITRTGNFSEEKKAIPYIRRSIIPQEVLNPNLATEAAINSANGGTDLSNQLNSSLVLNRNRQFTKIASIDYSKFISDQKKKKVFVVDRNIVDLFYVDKNVNYDEIYEYYVQPTLKDGTPGGRSEAVKIYISDILGIQPPLTFTGHQIDNRTILLNAVFEKNQKIKKVFIYKKDDDEIDFELLTSFEGVHDSVSYTDTNAPIGKTYSYRIFVENIFGSISHPGEITLYSSVQKYTQESRSNNLKIPLFSATQDQNSDFIRINIFPNDSKILFYRLDRKDITRGERGYFVPSQDETQYGGVGWESNQFFVTGSQEISFVDDTIDFGHIYQYRLVGFDLALNPTSPNFSLVQADRKNTIRTPTNLRTDILQNNPLKIRISWSNDNINQIQKDVVQNSQNALDLVRQRQVLQQNQLKEIQTFLSQSNPTASGLLVLENKLNLNKEQIAALSDLQNILTTQPSASFFRVQRRKSSENNYQTFPNTSNLFLDDESNVVVNGSVTYKLDKTVTGSMDSSTERAFGLPSYLQPNKIYAYRVAALDGVGFESNYTNEIIVPAIAPLSEPVSLTATVLNRKTKPISVKLEWRFISNKGIPDNSVIERKVDTEYDVFEVIGKSFLKSEFSDLNVETGQTYIYRITSVNTLGQRSNPAEVRISV